MEFSNLISKNASLKFIDADSGKDYSLLDIQEPLFKDDKDKKLVFLYLDNSIPSVSALLSFFNSRHCIALLSPQTHIDFKLSLESIYTPDIIFDLTRQEIEGYEARNSKNFVYQVALNHGASHIAPEIKVMLSTSGTTGSPKFVKLSEGNIVANAQSIIAYLPISSTDITPLNLPIYYSYGLSIFTTHCIAGGSIICGVKDIMNKIFWEEFDKYGFTSLAGVPYVYEMLQRLGFTKKKHPSIKYLTQAGGKMNERLLEQFAAYAQEADIAFYVMYGQTEATARMSYLPPDRLNDKLGSIGKAISNGKFDIAADTAELLYIGPNVFGGYAENKSDLADFHLTDVLHTGDVAKVDEDGFYYITGRIKRMVKIFGSRVNLDEVEQVLKNHFAGSQFFCNGIQDKFLLVATTATEPDNSTIVAFLRSHLDVHPSVIKVMIIDEVPLTANGKVNYSHIQELYGAS